MLFNYSYIDQDGNERSGSIDAMNEEVAIRSLQRRGLSISSIESAEGSKSILQMNIKLFERVTQRELVILSRQVATLFEAQISALRVFQLLGSETDNPKLQRVLNEVSQDLRGGTAISEALSQHPDVFSQFYVNMVKAGEEAGRLDQVFLYLADYLDRTYEIVNKTRNALIYPAFVITTFVVVMILMLTLVIPRISQILIESGQELPIYTKIVVGLSNFFVDYGFFLLIALAIGGGFFWRYIRTERGQYVLDQWKIAIPYIGSLYRRLYLSRISDNLSTMLASGIAMVRALEITSETVGNAVYAEILENATESVKAGGAVSEALATNNTEIPGIMVAMMRVGEESGELGNILETLAKFYRREVNNAVDTLLNLIEPALIVALGLGVGVLLASVLLPIYSISTAV